MAPGRRVLLTDRALSGVSGELDHCWDVVPTGRLTGCRCEHCLIRSSMVLPQATAGQDRGWEGVLELFVGDDWAEEHHDVELMDPAGRRLARARLPEGVAGTR